MQGVEQEFKGNIEKKIMGLLKQAEAEKNKYERSVANVKELSDQIHKYMEKFDNLKNDINDSSKKFEVHKENIESKKMEI